MERVKNILDIESIEYDKQVVIELIGKYLPDWRRIINELQRYSAGGKIDVGILSSLLDMHLDQLVNCILLLLLF